MSEKTVDELLKDGMSHAEVLGMIFPGLDQAAKAHAERLQAAKDDCRAAGVSLDVHMGDGFAHTLERFIDSRIKIALLERGGG